MIWLSWVLWHINHCRLFNAKTSLYIYIKYLRFCLVQFSDILTIVDYLIPYPLFTYILNIYMTCKHILFDDILKWAWALFLPKIKWFQVLLYHRHNSTSVICLHTVCSIWPIDRTLSGANTLSQSGPESNGNEEVLHIPPISKAGGTLPYQMGFELGSLILFPTMITIMLLY